VPSSFTPSWSTSAMVPLIRHVPMSDEAIIGPGLRRPSRLTAVVICPRREIRRCVVLIVPYFDDEAGIVKPCRA
jgi:hypothetical protein